MPELAVPMRLACKQHVRLPVELFKHLRGGAPAQRRRARIRPEQRLVKLAVNYLRLYLHATKVDVGHLQVTTAGDVVPRQYAKGSCLGSRANDSNR